MVPQSTAATSEFSRSLSAQLNIEGETCPSCGQQIPIEKLEEVRGRIALREHERTAAITARLEQKYEAERVRAEEQLEAARNTAAENEAGLKLQMEQLRQENVAALESEKAEAKKREEQIRIEASKAAEAGVADKVAAIKRTHEESEAALQQRLSQVESGKTAAEQQVTTLSQRFEALQKSNEFEVAKLKEAAALDAVRIRKEATEAAQAQFQKQLALNEGKVANANAKVLELEATLATVGEQHAKTVTEQLSAQREVLEKAKEDALNTEKAKAFEETQKLSNKVNELQRALEKKTNEELGEGAEIDLYEALKKEFPDDRITRIAKGAPGADIKHVVISHGNECGTIMYDSKNHNAFRSEHVTKLKTDQLAAKAEHAILSTHKFPQGTRQLHIQDGVILANPARVVLLATVIRQHIIQVHTLRLSNVEREQKTVALYDFITSDRCTQLLGRVEERCEELLDQQAKEVKWHEKHWRKEGEMLRAIQKAKGDLENEISVIIGAEAGV
jgi:hypothetical protein